VTESGDQSFTPLPPAPTMVRKKRKRRSKPRWYKRPRYIIPLVLLAILVTVGGVFAYRTRSAFQEVQSVSTPPPEVSGSALGLEDDVSIDTGPAQEAILERQQRENRQGTDSTQTPRSSQTVPATDEGTDAPGGGPNSTEEAAPTAAADPTAESTTAESSTRSGQLVDENATDTAATESATDQPAGTAGPNLPATSEAAPDEGSPAGLNLPDDGTPNSIMSADPPELQSTDGITVLLMGVDARDGESIDIGVRPDSLAVLHIDQSTGDCRMLAVPRDSRATLPGYGESKINHALAVGGIPYEMLVVEEYLGIELDNYVLVDFAGVETVVDELGGITVENPEAFEISGQTFEAGTLKLDGERALLYSRFRGDSEGDFGRISRQQQVLRGLMHEVADVNLVRLVPNMFSLLSDHFRTDYGMTDLIDLANEYRTSCSADSIETETIEGDVSMEFDDLMQMDLSFVVSDPEVVAENVAWLLMQEEPAGDPDDEGTPVANARKDDDIQTTSVARSILLTASQGPD
jgi:LCP family protein required for cell wall assembly